MCVVKPISSTACIALPSAAVVAVSLFPPGLFLGASVVWDVSSLWCFGGCDNASVSSPWFIASAVGEGVLSLSCLKRLCVALSVFLCRFSRSVRVVVFDVGGHSSSVAGGAHVRGAAGAILRPGKTLLVLALCDAVSLAL
ncbi:hypothetical protein DQ04_10501010 [Trypanosoma grayi]|uniref:hypothetical protein n=1 Tax=Trypanosoma grayi TaxID=71804 RepID=UPI0004F481C2|nr:hypothetical protein DQ04_10501010 [Trypanosoma grayi]KEG07227.1 hypothetical protein DQ04_10501010 [Trypanosoma grayi]